MKDWIVYIVCFSLFYSCSSGGNGGKDGSFYIVATTGMIADAAENIVGDSAKVEALMGPGVDPHLYKVSQGDLEMLTNADLILYNGLLLEGKMGEVLSNLAKQKPVVAIAEGIQDDRLRNVSEFAGGFDPHIWFDVNLWQQVVKYMSKQIQKYNPENENLYERNTNEYLTKLDSLDSWVQSQIESIPIQKRVLITAHDAFGYFGDAYNIEVKGLQGISTLSEPGLRDISKITDLIVDRKINAIFVESSVSRKTVESVVEGAQEKGYNVEVGGVLYSDALGEKGSPAGDYIGMVKENVSTITQALK